ncbi:MAG TPA: PD-(D/E)XK nuclease family transposase, partial [Arachidicoccus sp.]|nr:PD-(D/E)XK nuclease family transposase [Arachidicoccus sp.]
MEDETDVRYMDLVAEPPELYHKRPAPGTFMDPLSDFAFKTLFGKEQHKEILIAFLNDVFEGRKKIIDLQYINTEVKGETMGNRSIGIDVACVSDQGEQFIVEVQRRYQEFFNDRAFFYCGHSISSHAPKGKVDGIDWNYEQKAVYFVSILDFCLKDAPPEDYFHKVSLFYEGTDQRFTEKVQL